MTPIVDDRQGNVTINEYSLVDLEIIVFAILRLVANQVFCEFIIIVVLKIH